MHTVHMTTSSRRIGGMVVLGLLATVAPRNSFAQNAATSRASAPNAPAPRGDEEITFAKHVAPILQQKCQACHQPNSIAPMPLMTYEDTKKYADEIRDRVTEHVMPPWHIDKTVGIHDFKNDRSLSDEQIATLVRWLDHGMPFGKKEDLPPPAKFPDPTGWQLAKQLGEPDLVLKSPPYTLAARTQDKWFRPVTETGITEARWVRAMEIRPATPAGRKIVHHVLTMLEQHEEGDMLTNLASSAHDAQMGAGLFMEWSIGKTGEIFPADAGKLMLPGSKIRWEIHMFAIGQEMKDQQVELAIYFYPKGTVPQHRTVLKLFDVSRGSELDIPPEQTAMTQNFYVMPAPARIENFQPHMHMRGKAMSMEAVYPDGKRELLSAVNNFQWKWHVNYVFAENVAPLLPKGTMLVFTAWHDNTSANPNNPDPKQWVGWGDRTVDEMAHAWVDVTYLDQPEFDTLVAARKAKAQPVKRP
jgi:mono/diheme cytochrome c family protein